MLSGQSASKQYMWKKYPTIIEHIEPPTLNEWHNIIDKEEPVKLNYLTVKQINDDTVDKEIEVRAILNGISLLRSISLPNDELRFYYIQPDSDTLTDNVGMNMFNWRESFVASDVQIDMRIIEALGTNQKLWGHLQYCLLEKFL